MRPERIRGIHDLDMQVGLRRLPELPQAPISSPTRTMCSLTYPDGTGAQVSEYDIAGTAGQLQDHVVAGDGARTSADPRRLPEGVRHQRELRPPRHVVRLAVMHRHHPAIRRREDGLAESEEPLRRLGGQQRPPVPRGRRESSPDGDEVRGVGRGEQVGAVTRYPPSRAVPDQPRASEREPQCDRVGCGHRAPFALPAPGPGPGPAIAPYNRSLRDGRGIRGLGHASAIPTTAAPADERRPPDGADQNFVVVDRVDDAVLVPPGRPVALEFGLVGGLKGEGPGAAGGRRRRWSRRPRRGVVCPAGAPPSAAASAPARRSDRSPRPAAPSRATPRCRISPEDRLARGEDAVPAVGGAVSKARPARPRRAATRPGRP